MTDRGGEGTDASNRRPATVRARCMPGAPVARPPRASDGRRARPTIAIPATYDRRRWLVNVRRLRDARIKCRVSGARCQGAGT